jgi:tetratricopeptide (TPR) repeat protein
MIALTTFPSLATAQGESGASVKESQATLDAAKSAYNGERYQEAANLFVSAAQIDPGAEHHEGTPYRDLARCLFWMSNYDKAVFWYDQYLHHWPSATDFSAVEEERNTANSRREDSDRPVEVTEIYDRSLRLLVDTLRTRISEGAPAYTKEGGGTSRLYFQAVKNGYALPDLANIARTLRGQLLREMSARWSGSDDGPMPAFGARGEPVEASSGRLATLRTLAPRGDEVTAIEAWQRLVHAWDDFEKEQYGAAAGGLLDAGGALPELNWIPYAAALAQLRDGDGGAAVATLQAARKGAPEAVRPYYLLLEAEALRSTGHYADAAALYLGVAE